MTKVDIRPAVATDLPNLIKMNHSCSSDYVWQMDSIQNEGQAGAVFREIRLPRSITIAYPRPVSHLTEEWSRRAGMLVAIVDSGLAGYIRLSDKVIPQIALITDVVVSPNLRRKGIGTALILAAQAWALERGNRQIIIEMISKNAVGVRLAKKLGYEFCGYNDHYYLSQDVALFFVHSL